MSKSLYFIINSGCDSVTCGLVEIPDALIESVIYNIRNLNRNSTYYCMPTIGLYKTDMKYFKEITRESSEYEKAYNNNSILYFGKKMYTFAEDESINYYNEMYFTSNCEDLCYVDREDNDG